MGGFSCVLMTILIRVQMSDCAAYNEPFRKPYFNQREDLKIAATMECRNMWGEIFCISHVYIPVHVSLV